MRALGGPALDLFYKPVGADPDYTRPLHSVEWHYYVRGTSRTIPTQLYYGYGQTNAALYRPLIGLGINIAAIGTHWRHGTEIVSENFIDARVGGGSWVDLGTGGGLFLGNMDLGDSLNIDFRMNIPDPYPIDEGPVTYVTGAAMDDNALLWTTLDTTQATEVEIIVSGDETPFAITVVGQTITVTVETDVNGDAVTTAETVITEIAGDPVASLMVSAANYGVSEGTGVVEAVSAFTLANGVRKGPINFQIVFTSGNMLGDPGESGLCDTFITGLCDQKGAAMLKSSSAQNIDWLLGRAFVVTAADGTSLADFVEFPTVD